MSDPIRIRWRVPIITLVLAATAVPVELRSPAGVRLDFGVGLTDVVGNVVGYVPVGLVLGDLGRATAIALGGLLSLFAETSQLFMMHRTPSAVDLATNLIGTALGAYLGRRWQICRLEWRIHRSWAVPAAALAIALLWGMWNRAGAQPNARGMSLPGGLELHLKLDESDGPTVMDASGHGVTGRLRGRPQHAAGVLGGALRFDGRRDCIDLGHPNGLRLEGSMTVSAWINPSSFPRDDAAIVSSMMDWGFQLDTTIDRGPRSIGFKLTDACGELMARYGKSPLAAGAWVHVAGVYDAAAKSLDVYLNGELDNGFLLGSITGRQRSSRGTVYVGRRSSPTGYEFAGSVDDVWICSAALTASQIAAVMHGRQVDLDDVPASSSAVGTNAARFPGASPEAACGMLSDPEDAQIPAAAGLLGVLVAVACLGFARPRLAAWASLMLGLSAGLLLVAFTTTPLPAFNLWLVPLTCFAGSASVVSACHRLWLG